MITHVKGSLFESPAKVLVNTINTVGVMGKGVAKSFKEIYPEMFTRYQELCENKMIDIGKLWIYRTDNKWILNFPTKKHWRSPSNIEYIELGLKKFRDNYSECGITNISFPRLGCGHGELDWADVKPLMESYLSDLPIDVFIYTFPADKTIPEHKRIDEIRSWLRSEPESLAFIEVWDDLKNIIHERGSNRRQPDGAVYSLVIVNAPEEGIKINIGPIEERNKLIEAIGKLKQLLSFGKEPRILDKNAIFLPRDYMLDLWQSLRSFGFLSEFIVPAGIEGLWPYLFSLMSELEYLKPVEIEIQTKIDFEHNEALQLVPRIVHTPFELSEEHHALNQICR